MSKEPLATDQTITLPVPQELAVRFIEEQSLTNRSRRPCFRLSYGESDLGFWRIDDLVTTGIDGIPRLIATLRKVLP